MILQLLNAEQKKILFLASFSDCFLPVSVAQQHPDNESVYPLIILI